MPRSPLHRSRESPLLVEVSKKATFWPEIRLYSSVSVELGLGRIDIQLVCWRDLRKCLSKALLRQESLYGLLLQKERG